MNDIAAGTLLAGKYRLQSLIGRGGMGSVWRAEHLGLSAPVAVKLLDLVHFDGASEAVNRFHREARAAAAIRSPHVVQILDHGVDPTFGIPFIVMELMEGESLANRLARCGHISPLEVARVFTHVARALSRAHEAGIVHRDLKPDNVFLVVNEDEEVAKVLDFGIAKAQAHALGQDSSTRTGAIMGTAYYMSPEQISGTKNVDYRTDLWAMGVMACECLTGRRPFESETIGGITLKICVEPVPLPSSLAPVPPGFDEWFTRIVHRDPAQRFASARAAADALRQVCTGEAAVQAISGGVPQASAAAPATHAGTAGSLSLSRSSHELETVSVPKRKSVVPWLLGGALLLVLAGGFWLRASRSQVAVATPTSPSAPLAAAPASPGIAPLSTPSFAAPQLAASAPTPEIAVSSTPSSTVRADEVAQPPARPARPGVAVRPTAPPRSAPVVPPPPAKPAETASQSKPVTTPAPARDLLDSR